LTDAAGCPNYGNAQKADFAKFFEQPKADFSLKMTMLRCSVIPDIRREHD
jgi:hypothetical protein